MSVCVYVYHWLLGETLPPPPYGIFGTYMSINLGARAARTSLSKIRASGGCGRLALSKSVTLPSDCVKSIYRHIWIRCDNSGGNQSF